MSNIMEKILEEEKEAEKLMYGDGEEPTEEKAQATEEEVEETEEQTDPEEDLESDSEETTEPEEKSKPKPKRENWKKRHINYKASTDQTIHELRTERVQLRAENEELRDRLHEMGLRIQELEKKAQPESDPFEGVFTQEDEDLLGSEAIAAMKKAALANRKTESVTDPRIDQLEKELREMRKKELEKAKRETEQYEEQARDRLRMKLLEIVPNFEQVDRDPGFEEYLNDVDEMSNKVRIQLFANAVNSLDVAGVARFYKEYAQMKGKKTSFTDDFITPTGDGATEVNPDRGAKRTYHISEYEKFMDDVAKGRYRGKEKEAQKLELMYDKAYQDGRLVE